VRRRWVREHRGETSPSPDLVFDLYDPARGWVPKPGVRDLELRGGWRLSTNSKGARGAAERPYENQAGVARILLFGDSFTFGEEVSDDETYGRFLEGMLPGVEVVNLGVHGYGHDQMLIHLREEGVRTQADVVILGFTDTDIGRNVLSFRSYAKPRFVLDGGRLRLVGSPVPPPETSCVPTPGGRARSTSWRCSPTPSCAASAPGRRSWNLRAKSRRRGRGPSSRRATPSSGDPTRAPTPAPPGTG